MTKAAPFGACETLATATIYLCNISIQSSSLLLFFRVRALYRTNKIIICLFLLLWAGVCCAGVISTMGLSGTTIGPTQYCTDKSGPQNTYIFAIAVFVNDTLTLLATSWGLKDITLGENKTFCENLRAITIGSNLTRFSKAFLHDGQRYYLYVRFTGRMISLLAQLAFSGLLSGFPFSLS